MPCNGESTTSSYPFPSTRYLGSKRKIVEYLDEITRDMEFGTVLDAFGGTGSVSHMFKKQGKSVTFNDTLRFNSVIGKALIENQNTLLSDDDIEKLLDIPREHPTFIEDNFSGIYFTDEENQWIDGYISNIPVLDDEYKEAIAYFAIFQACTFKRPFGRYHRANLNMRMADVERSFGNKQAWNTPFPDCIRRFAYEANRSIFNNGKICHSYNMDALDLPSDYDLVYIDPPYADCKGAISDYLGNYHFLEGIADYDNWGRHISTKYKHRPYTDDRCSSWKDRDCISSDFEQLFSRFRDSILVVSYRLDGTPSIDTIVEMLGKYKDNVTYSTIPYKYALSKNKTAEVVIIAE